MVLYSGNQQQLSSSYIIPNQWQNSPTCTEVETEPILNRQHWNLTFTSDFKTCSCNYFCAVVKCQFVHRDPMGFSRVFPLTHFLILWRNFVLTRTRSAYRAYYSSHTALGAFTSLFFSVLLSFCFIFSSWMSCSTSQMSRKTSRVSVWRIWPPSNSIIAFIEVHFDPGKFTPKVFLKIVYSKRSELCPMIVFYVHMLFVSFQWPTHYYQII